MTAAPIVDHEVRHPNAGVLVNIEPERGGDVISSLAQAELLWGVETAPLQARWGESVLPIADKVATVRLSIEADPRPLSVVGAGYVPIPNLDAFMPLQPLLDAGKITLTQAGQTKNGRHVFVLAELTEGTTMLDVDPHKRFLMARTSHDGSAALRISPWAQRLFCTNQIPALVSRFGGRQINVVSVQHGKGAMERVGNLSEELGMMVGILDEFDEEWRVLASTALPADRLDVAVQRLLPMPTGILTTRQIDSIGRSRAKIVELAEGQANENIAGTKAAFVAAVTEWDQWFRGQSAVRRSTRLLEGRSDELVRRAFELVSA